MTPLVVLLVSIAAARLVIAAALIAVVAGVAFLAARPPGAAPGTPRAPHDDFWVLVSRQVLAFGAGSLGAPLLFLLGASLMAGDEMQRALEEIGGAFFLGFVVTVVYSAPLYATVLAAAARGPDARRRLGTWRSVFAGVMYPAGVVVLALTQASGIAMVAWAIVGPAALGWVAAHTYAPTRRFERSRGAPGPPAIGASPDRDPGP